MNQLIREDNKPLDRTYIYEYDTAGNITAKWEHSYIYDDFPYSYVPKKEYSYRKTGWKDQLISYDGQSITYDVLGNPFTYLGHTLTWGRVRQLKSFDDNTFEYDAWGRRTKKNGIWYDYQNGKLYREGRPNGDRITYFYDAYGVCGFNYRYNWHEDDESGNTFDEANYFYKKNLQGDITAIYSSTGTKVAEYLYDAWGNCTIVTDIDGIATLNPIRYRGYYYDTETELYYVSSRYYDPKIGRWINADIPETLTSDFENFSQYNLFAYCFNNPVNSSDETGTWPNWATKLIVGTACAIVAVSITVATAGTGAAAVVPAVIAVGKSIAISTAIGAGIGATSHVMSTGNTDGVFQAAVEGAVDGYMWGGIGTAASATKNALQTAGTIPKKVKVSQLTNSPTDPYTTIEPKQGKVVQKINEIQIKGRYEYPSVKSIGNGLYEIQGGHHTVQALRSLGKKYVNVWLVK